MTSDLGTIIESKNADFIKVVSSMSVVDINKLKKVLEFEYSKLECYKNQMLELKFSKENGHVVDGVNVHDTLSGLYVCLQKIEDKATLCVEIMNEKRSKTS